MKVSQLCTKARISDVMYYEVLAYVCSFESVDVLQHWCGS